MNRTAPFLALALLAAACAAETTKPAAPPAGAPNAAAGASASVTAVEKSTASKDYPLETCVVSGDKLGSMGDRVAYKVGGVEVQLCCDGCVDELRKDPAKYVAKVAAAKK